MRRRGTVRATSHKPVRCPLSVLRLVFSLRLQSFGGLCPFVPFGGRWPRFPFDGLPHRVAPGMAAASRAACHFVAWSPANHAARASCCMSAVA